MNGVRFGRIAQFFATRRADRTIVASAQEATLAAEVYDSTRKTHYLFVQSFEGGTVAPKEGDPDTYTLTLQHGLGQTIYFADRPGRDAGAMPTPQFLAGLGFTDENPPNAALVIDDGSGGTDIAVLELRNPLFDPVSPGVIYDAKVLGEWERSLEMGFSEVPTDLAAVPEIFGNAHLFIDDCADGPISCCGHGFAQRLVSQPQPYCWTWANWSCVPCVPYYHQNLEAWETQIYWSLQCRANFAGCGDGCLAQWGDCPPENDNIHGVDF